MLQQRFNRRRGVSAIVALIFLVIIGTIAAALFTISHNNLRSAANFGEIEQARITAESGLRFFAYRLQYMPGKPMPYKGKISGTLAWNQLWVNPSNAKDGLAPCIQNDFQNRMAATVTYTNTNGDHSLKITPIALDAGSTFELGVVQEPTDGRILAVTSTGQCRNAKRTVRMNFWMDKRIDAAVHSWVPPQLGKNTFVVGNSVINTKYKKRSEGTVLLSISDFRDRSGAGQDQLFAQFQELLRSKYEGRDNCIRNAPENAEAWSAAVQLVGDLNGDNMINEYDVFIKAYDRNYDSTAIDPLRGPQLNRNDYGANTGDDPNLFDGIDGLTRDLKPVEASTDEDKDGDIDKHDSHVLHKKGHLDNLIDNLDQYAKILGKLKVINTGELDDPLPRDKFEGPVYDPNDPNAQGVLILEPDEGDPSGVIMDPQTYSSACDALASLSGPDAGATVKDKPSRSLRNAVISTAYLDVSQPRGGQPAGGPEFAHELVQVLDPGATSLKVGQVISPADLDAANKALKGNQQKATLNYNADWSIERTPWGSTSSQAIYKRPVFRNVRFVNCTIPKGLNAVFVNCTFEGVTFVELQENINNGQTSPETWDWIDKRTDKGEGTNRNTQVQLPDPAVAPGAKVFASTDIRTNGSENGNNLRFDSCTFNGPIASDCPSAYTHCANSWEFTGNTLVDNQWEDPQTGDATVTILAPQTNIEMGSYTDGKQNIVKMQGVVVAGNIDIRGKGWVDGSMINTGNGAGSMTLGYFGKSDSTTSLDLSDLSRCGNMMLRYNPLRALPDGIAIPVSISPDPETYVEVLDAH